MKYAATVLSLSLLFICPLKAQQNKQQKIDSLVKITKTSENDMAKVAAYGTLYELVQFNNPLESFEYAKQELKYAKKASYLRGQSTAYLHFADYYKRLGELDSARYYFDISTRQGKKIKNLSENLRVELFLNHSRASFEQSLGNYDSALKYAYRNVEIYEKRDSLKVDLKGANVGIYDLIGGIHLDMGNYELASIETYKAVRFFEKKNDSLRMGDAFMQLGNINFKQKEFASSIENTEKAYAIYQTFKDTEYSALASLLLGNGLLKLNRTEEAKGYFNLALELGEKLKNSYIQGDAITDLGSLYLKQGDFENAKKATTDALKIHKKLEYQIKIASDLNQLAKVNLELGNSSKAIVDLNSSLLITQNIKAKDVQSEAFLLRSKSYKRKGDFKKALFDYEAHKTLTDSIYSLTKSKQIQEIRTIYETEKKEQQIAFQEKEITVLEQEAKINNQQQWLLGGGMTLSFLALGFGFYGFRQKTKRSKLAKEKVDAELAFKKKELTTHALHLAKKNEVLENVKLKAKDLKLQGDTKGYQELIKTINFDQQDDKNWENFTQYFEQVHKDFSRTVRERYPEVTKNELRLMALLKMNLSTKEIANILSISIAGVKKARNRLRKKLEITPEESLEELVITI